MVGYLHWTYLPHACTVLNLLLSSKIQLYQSYRRGLAHGSLSEIVSQISILQFKKKKKNDGCSTRLITRGLYKKYVVHLEFGYEVRIIIK